MQRNIYREYKAMGICVRCHQERAEIGRPMCAGCIARNKEAWGRYYYRHRDEVLKKDREEREARRAAGLCTYCGERAPEDGRTYCAICRERRKAWHAAMTVQERAYYSNARYREQVARRKARLEKGLCMVCGKLPVVEGQQKCLSCRDKARASHDRWKARQQHADD